MSRLPRLGRWAPCLATGAFAALLWSAHAGAQAGDVSETAAATGLTGVTHYRQGSEAVIYSVGLQDIVPPINDTDLGSFGVATNRGVQLTISDLSNPTGMVPSDFVELRLYSSTDAVHDGLDPLLATASPVNIGSITELDVTGLPLGGVQRRIATTPAVTYLFVTAVLSPSAGYGRAFRVSAAANHIGLYESGLIPAGDYWKGSPIFAMDGNSIIIGAQEPEYLTRPRGGTIPFGGEPVMLVLILGTGAYLARRRTSGS